MKKTILVTGATSGFGRAIAERFAQNDYRVIVTGRREGRLQDFEKELVEKYKTEVIALTFDVRKKQEVAHAIHELGKQVSQIDILVNNAGLAAGFSSIDEGDTEDWDTMIDTNLKGLLYVTKSVVPIMKHQCSGHIFNIGSTAGKVVYKNGNVYCATKFGVDALTQGMRIDLLPYGIKVTAVNPGMAETEFSLVRFKGDEQKAKSVYNDVNPLQPKDIADIIWYCANLPAHVCINDLTVTCTTQANSVYSIRNSDRKLPTAE